VRLLLLNSCMKELTFVIIVVHNTYLNVEQTHSMAWWLFE